MKIAAWLATVCMSLMVGSVQAEPTRNADIEKVIDQQLQAFQADDFKAAFEFAAPSIQKKFGTPEKFGFAVIHGYPMVWRPTEVQYIGVEQYTGQALQKVMITDRHKTLHLLIYQMLPLDQGWRIGGVQIVRQPKSDT
jgi:alpha-D-ribose 1-methylphosphonate 5-triphosphate diphosphatase PhnM